MSSFGMVFFVGAGPGDPDLITVKGRQLLQKANLLLYAGSLVQEKFLDYLPDGGLAYSTAGMKLDEQIRIMEKAVRDGKLVVRLHTGDPSVFGATAEQMQALDELEIPYQVIPGVSSAFAAAAALKIELTLPENTQTIIFARQSGRTLVPEREMLRNLAAHRSSLIIFLSTGMIETVVEELKKAGYAPEMPIAVVYRVTWPDEKIIYGCLENIAEKVLASEITHHALIVVSPALQKSVDKKFPFSHLYGTAQEETQKENSIAIISLTKKGLDVGRKLLAVYEKSFLYAPQRFLEDPCPERCLPYDISIRQILHTAFQKHKSLICVMASGIVVRELAPLLKSKHTDPAVVVVDESGKYCISLLGGHKGGANALAKKCADILQGQAVITTASDVQALPALDLLPEIYGWHMRFEKNLTAISAVVVNDEPLLVYQDCGSRTWFPHELPQQWKMAASFEEIIQSDIPNVFCISFRDCCKINEKSSKRLLVFHPKCLHVGIGCNRNTPAEEIYEAISETFHNYSLALESINSLATIDLKADEPGLLELCTQKNWPIRFFSVEKLREVKGIPNPSESVKRNIGTAGVAEPAALLSAKASTWLVKKQKFSNVTVAVTVEEEEK